MSRTIGWFTGITSILFPILRSAALNLNKLIAKVKDRRCLAMARMNKLKPFLDYLACISIVTFNYHSIGCEDDLFDIVNIGQDRVDEDR